MAVETPVNGGVPMDESPFVDLADLNVGRKETPANPWKGLVGQQIVILGTAPTESGKGSALFVAPDQVSVKDGQLNVTGETRTLELFRGGLRVLAAAAAKAGGKAIRVTIEQKKRGIGFK